MTQNDSPRTIRVVDTTVDEGAADDEAFNITVLSCSGLPCLEEARGLPSSESSKDSRTSAARVLLLHKFIRSEGGLFSSSNSLLHISQESVAVHSSSL